MPIWDFIRSGMYFWQKSMRKTIANGLVERFHRQLKSALKASPHPNHWTDMLHLVLLGIRTTLKMYDR